MLTRVLHAGSNMTTLTVDCCPLRDRPSIGMQPASVSINDYAVEVTSLMMMATINIRPKSPSHCPPLSLASGLDDSRFSTYFLEPFISPEILLTVAYRQTRPLKYHNMVI